MTNILRAGRLSGTALALVLGGALLAGTASAETLKMAWATDATGLDPHKQTAFTSLRLLELIYEPLVRLNADLEIVPALATSWEFNAEGTQLTFKLNPAAQFQDGSKLTSADVKATFERLLDEATAAAGRANFLSIASIDTPDDQTVVFNLSQPDVPILAAMASANASIVSKAAIETGTVETQPNGSGPFKLASREPNQKTELVAFEGWAGGKAGVDGVTISTLPDESAILAALRAGQVDFAMINDPLIATLVPDEPGLVLTRTPSINYRVLQLNASRGAMGELKVRQAISCAIDRQEIIDLASEGEGRVIGPMTVPAYANPVEDLFCYTPDLDKAKALMAEAGHADGFEATVIASNGSAATAAAEAQVIQEQLSKIGIKLDIKMMELNVYVDAWLAGDFDMAVALNGGRSDPYPMYNRYWTKAGNLQKVAQYIDDELDSLMAQGRTETDPAKRVEIFKALEKHLTEVSPWIWTYAAFNYTAQTEKLQGFEPNPTGAIYSLANVTLAK